MFSAFTVLALSKMIGFIKNGWIGSVATIALTVAAKVALNYVLPGSGPAADFAQAAYDFSHGDVAGAVINTVSGVAGVATGGVSNAMKEAMKGSAKETVAETGEQIAKGATKNLINLTLNLNLNLNLFGWCQKIIPS